MWKNLEDMQNLLLFILLSVLVSATALRPSVSHASFEDGQSAIEVTETPKRARFSPRVGRQAAAKYMAPERPDAAKAETTGSEDSNRSPAGTPSDHYLAVHVGWFVNDNAYKVGAPESQTNVGRYNFGLTYRMGEWVNSMDLLFRFDVSRYAYAEGGVTKFSLMPMITFPDASSRFPLYFGAGIGLGVFGNQLAGESTLALDYSLVGGARFFNLWGQTGLFVEGGVKNHLHLLSDGQFNGTFIASGLVFTF